MGSSKKEQTCLRNFKYYELFNASSSQIRLIKYYIILTGFWVIFSCLLKGIRSYPSSSSPS